MKVKKDFLSQQNWHITNTISVVIYQITSKTFGTSERFFVFIYRVFQHSLTKTKLENVLRVISHNHCSYLLAKSIKYSKVTKLQKRETDIPFMQFYSSLSFVETLRIC